MAFAKYTCFDLTLTGGIARLHMNRPDLLNRFDAPLHTEFAKALGELALTLDVAVLLISAEGRAFSAGGDMEMMREGNASKPIRDRLSQEAMVIFDTLVALPFPVICAVQGAAVGLGASIVALSDIAVAWSKAKISDPHVVLGLVAGDGGIIGWSQAIGINRAKRYLLTGEPVTGEVAYQLGLVSDVVETPEEVRPAAEAIAAKIAAMPMGGVRGTKRAFAQLTRQFTGAVFELGLAYEMECMAGQEMMTELDKLAKKAAAKPSK